MNTLHQGMETHTQALEAPKHKKARPGAKGVNKTKSGCQTCKKRHRKCDEQKPACNNCIRAGWTCDFQSSSVDDEFEPAKPLAKSSQRKQRREQQQQQRLQEANESALVAVASRPNKPPSSFVGRLGAEDLVKLDLFASVAVKAMGISLNAPFLERIMLRAVQTEPCILHAALSWSGLTRHVYWRGDRASRALSERQGFEHYNRSIRHLRSLPRNRRTTELAILAGHIYASIDFNLGLMDRLVTHTQATLGMAEEMGAVMMAGEEPSEDSDSIVRLVRKVHAEFSAQIQAWNEASQGRDRGLISVGEAEVGSMQRLVLNDAQAEGSTSQYYPGEEEEMREAVVEELEDDT